MSEPLIITQTLKVTFNQDPDCWSKEDQLLSIETIDSGDGDFFVMNTDRWAFDDIDEVINILNTFKEKYEKLTK